MNECIERITKQHSYFNVNNICFWWTKSLHFCFDRNGDVIFCLWTKYGSTLWQHTRPNWCICKYIIECNFCFICISYFCDVRFKYLNKLEIQEWKTKFLDYNHSLDHNTRQFYRNFFIINNWSQLIELECLSMKIIL